MNSVAVALMTAALGVALTTLAHAAKSDSLFVLSNNLGDVIAAEGPCGLTYDQSAIAAFIEQNVPADDMEWAGMLDLAVRLEKRNLAEMAPSARTAFCTQIRRVAKTYGFIK